MYFNVIIQRAQSIDIYRSTYIKFYKLIYRDKRLPGLQQKVQDGGMQTKKLFGVTDNRDTVSLVHAYLDSRQCTLSVSSLLYINNSSLKYEKNLPLQ